MTDTPHSPAHPVTSGMAISGMILGIVGLVFAWVPILDIVMGGLAVVLSAVGLKRCNTGIGGGRGMAIAGLVCGILTVSAGFIFMLVLAGSSAST